MTDIASLPPYEQISNEPIRQAAAALDAARAAQEQAQKDVVELQQTREQAQWADAERDARARSEGKLAKRARTATAEHDKKTEAAEHEHRVCQLAVKEARDHLRAVLSEHEEVWKAEVVADLEGFDAAWNELVTGLARLHPQRGAARALAKKLGGAQLLGVGALSFPLKDLGLSGQLDRDAMRLVGQLTTADVLDRLQSLGTAPQPEDEHEPRLLEKPVVDDGLTEFERAAALASHRRQMLNLDPGPDREQEEKEAWERAHGIVREDGRIVDWAVVNE